MELTITCTLIDGAHHRMYISECTSYGGPHHLMYILWWAQSLNVHPILGHINECASYGGPH